MAITHGYKLLRVLACAAALMTSVVAQPPVNSHRILPIGKMTSDVEILFGDPDKSGEPFVMRIRELAGGIIPPHRHPVDEHITVVQGTVYFAVGDKFDRGVMREMKTGSYAFIPKGRIMFGYTPEAAIVQVHGIGPFNIDWRSTAGWRNELRTLDSPDAVVIFKFKRGDRVATPRGKGRIRQGYDSGEVIGYEIDGDDGTLFIAEECEIVAGGSLQSRLKAGDRACFARGESSVSGGEKHSH
jgi:quercetin dioxygenase-like cupin family protein